MCLCYTYVFQDIFDGHALIPFEPKVTHLNAAQSGARVQDLPAQVSQDVDYFTE